MTNSEHTRWCIRKLPCLAAECTVHWFMYGYDPRKSAQWLNHT